MCLPMSRNIPYVLTWQREHRDVSSYYTVIVNVTVTTNVVRGVTASREEYHRGMEDARADTQTGRTTISHNVPASFNGEIASNQVKGEADRSCSEPGAVLDQSFIAPLIFSHYSGIL